MPNGSSLLPSTHDEERLRTYRQFLLEPNVAVRCDDLTSPLFPPSSFRRRRHGLEIEKDLVDYGAVSNAESHPIGCFALQ